MKLIYGQKEINMSYKKNGISLVKVVIVILLLASVVGGLAYLSKGFSDWKVSDWFKPKQEEVIEDNGVNLVEHYTIQTEDIDLSISIYELIESLKPEWVYDDNMDSVSIPDYYKIQLYNYNDSTILIYQGLIRVVGGHFGDFYLYQLNGYNEGGGYNTLFTFNFDLCSPIFVSLEYVGSGFGYIYS
jgi:hypothetical protein